MTDDIPEATRERPPTASVASAKPKAPVFVFAISAAILAILGGAGTAIVLSRTPTQMSTEAATYAEVGLQQALIDIGLPVTSSDTLLGHKPYEEAPEGSLVALTADGGIRLRRSAANAFVEMADAARDANVYISLLSGFRSAEQQQYLFFGIKEEQTQRASERASVSAPPGYSEHHTGYAIDVGDADASDTDLDEEFENTDAFKWMQENAARYSFELSFEEDESSGVSYEPWHWRYIGDRHSLETFYGSP